MDSGPWSDHDEFGMLAENAAEFDLPWRGPPPVRRASVALGDGRRLSVVRWGSTHPDVVLLHGGAQNAHTWDTVALALDRPALAIDLPGHGHSDWRADHHYTLAGNAADVAVAIEEYAQPPVPLVGMSLGGLTAIALAAARSDLVSRLMLVDVTPGVSRERAEPIAAFVAGPEHFDSFEEILDRTKAFNPTRSDASLRRGVLHNAIEEDGGRWRWRYDRIRLESAEAGATADFSAQWDALSRTTIPLVLVRGEHGIVTDAEVEELRRRRGDASVEVVAGAGHSIQGDRPRELASVITRFLDE